MVDVGGARIARAARALVGVLVGVFARLWLWTLRVEVLEHPALASVRDRPWVLSFFHGTQWPLLAWRRRRPTVVMVSWSLDGELQANALRVQGLSVVRGSSSRGGMRGLVKLGRVLRAGGRDAAFAVDGPKGPYGVPKGGAALAASSARGVLVPLGSAFVSGLVLERSWDHFGLAWPFSRVVVCLGAPIEPSAANGEALGKAIARANERAAAAMARSDRGVVAGASSGSGAARPTK